MRFGSTRLDELLSALDRQLALAGNGEFAIVVCGGSALAAIGLVVRTTRDVDVLGLARTTSSGVVVERLAELPERLPRLRLKVARDFNLPADWLNLGPAPQVGMGLPVGFGTRVEQRRYGSRLTVYTLAAATRFTSSCTLQSTRTATTFRTLRCSSRPEPSCLRPRVGLSRRTCPARFGKA